MFKSYIFRNCNAAIINITVEEYSNYVKFKVLKL